MSNIYDIKQLKASKIYITHLESILKVVDLSIKGLQHFELYDSVRRILNVMRDEQKILQLHLEKQKHILKNKGKL